MEHKNERDARESEEIKKSKRVNKSIEKVTTMSQIVELFKTHKIDEIVVASEKTNIPGTKEMIQGLRPDLDAYMALYLLNEYNKKPLNKVYNENSRTTVVKKTGEEIYDGKNELLEQIKPYKESAEDETSNKLIVYVDTGGEWLKIEKDGVVSTVYIDHHGHGNKQATSGTKMMLEIMRKADMLKELPLWMSKLVNFTNDIDNLSYINKKDSKKKRTFNESYFRNEWPNSLYALAEKQIPFETLIELFKSGLIKDPAKPFTEDELSGKLGSFMVGENSIRDLCKQKREEVSKCLENGISKSIKHNKNINLETAELGKIIYHNFFIEKGKANTIPNYLAMKATVAKGYDSFVSWNEKNNEFYINAIESKSLVDIAKKLNEKFPGCANEIRGKFIFGKINDMTEEEFLEIIGINIPSDGEKEKNDAELAQKEIEKKREQLYIRIEEYRKNLKNYNEEKARLETKLEKLNVLLEISKKKDEEAYLNSLEKESAVEPEEVVEESKNTETEIDTKNSDIENEEEINEEKIQTENEIKGEEEKTETIKIEDGGVITIFSEPKQIRIEEVINENITPEEKEEIKKEFPNQNIEEVIENQVVEQMNDKTVEPVEKREKDNLLRKAGRKIKNYFLVVLVSASTFQVSSFTKTSESAVLAYNNIKVENLKDWENINLYEDEVNKLENISIITKAHENSNNKFIIIDKQNGKAHRYQGDNLIKSYNVCLGDSIGDEQTQLKSVYRKKFDDSEKVFHRRPEVSIDEATYVENGERYLKDDYEALTDWNEGNMQTGAGVYTISNKGPFLDDFGIFLKNERGLQVATSLHVNNRLKTKAPDFRFTNGCVGFSKEDLYELYKITSSGEKIYILPDNPHNKFQIIDGELRFLSNQQNVNKTIRPYEPKSIMLKAENPNENSKVWLMTLSENKTKLMSLYPTISNDVYNELAKIAYGIMGQESTFGTYGGIRGHFGKVKDLGASTVGLKPSVGLGQVRLENVEPKIRKAFNMQKNNDLFDIKTNAIATMSILLDNYLYVSYNKKEGEYKKLVILKYNAALEAKRIIKGNKTLEQLGPRAKGYVKKVLNYSKLAKVYTTNTNDNYYNPNWNYGQPNSLAMNEVRN